MFLQLFRVGKEDCILLLLAVPNCKGLAVLPAIADGTAVRRVAYHLKGCGNRHEGTRRAERINVAALLGIRRLFVQEGDQADVEAEHLSLREQVAEVILNGASPADVHNRNFLFRTAQRSLRTVGKQEGAFFVPLRFHAVEKLFVGKERLHALVLPGVGDHFFWRKFVPHEILAHGFEFHAERGEERLHRLNRVLIPEAHEFLRADLAERRHEGRKATHLEKIRLRIGALRDRGHRVVNLLVELTFARKEVDFLDAPRHCLFREVLHKAVEEEAHIVGAGKRRARVLQRFFRISDKVPLPLLSFFMLLRGQIALGRNPEPLRDFHIAVGVVPEMHVRSRCDAEQLLCLLKKSARALVNAEVAGDQHALQGLRKARRRE